MCICVEASQHRALPSDLGTQRTPASAHYQAQYWTSVSETYGITIAETHNRFLVQPSTQMFRLEEHVGYFHVYLIKTLVVEEADSPLRQKVR